VEVVTLVMEVALLLEVLEGEALLALVVHQAQQDKVMLEVMAQVAVVRQLAVVVVVLVLPEQTELVITLELAVMV
jgi:hypothetical protein